MDFGHEVMSGELRLSFQRVTDEPQRVDRQLHHKGRLDKSPCADTSFSYSQSKTELL